MNSPIKTPCKNLAFVYTAEYALCQNLAVRLLTRCFTARTKLQGMNKVIPLFRSALLVKILMIKTTSYAADAA